MSKEIAKRNENEEVVVYETETGRVILSPEIIKKYLVSGDPAKVTDAEVFMFLKLCQHQRLNPFLREAYLIKYSADEPATFVVGKDTFVKRAARCELCGGWQAGVIIRKKDGTLEYRTGTLVLSDEELVGGWAKVYRKDWREPIEISVSLQEYIRKKKDGQPTRSWREMPATMIRKVALVQALREAFPEQFQGMYTPEEMPIDDSQLPDEPVNVNVEPETPTEERNNVVELPVKPATAPETQTTQIIELNNVAIVSEPVIKKTKKGTDIMSVKLLADEGEYDVVINEPEIMEKMETRLLIKKVVLKKFPSGTLLVVKIEE